MSLKRYGKRVIGYPDQPIPVVSTADWFDRNVRTAPGRFVADYLRSLFPILGWITRYSMLLSSSSSAPTPSHLLQISDGLQAI
jgi:hypothetical protein